MKLEVVRVGLMIQQVQSTIIESDEETAPGNSRHQRGGNQMEVSHVTAHISNNPRNTVQGKIAQQLYKAGSKESNGSKSNLRRDDSPEFDPGFVGIEKSKNPYPHMNQPNIGQNNNGYDYANNIDRFRNSQNEWANRNGPNSQRMRSNTNQSPGMMNSYGQNRGGGSNHPMMGYDKHNPPTPSPMLQQLLNGQRGPNFGMNFIPPRPNYNNNNNNSNNGMYGRNRHNSMGPYNGHRGSPGGPGGPNFSNTGNNWQQNRMGNSYAGNRDYRNMNWNNYSMNQYNFNIEDSWAHQVGTEIFLKHDSNRSGSIEISEFPMMINEFFGRLKKSSPTVNDCYFLMYKYDNNRDGKIDMEEFRSMINEIIHR